MQRVRASLLERSCRAYGQKIVNFANRLRRLRRSQHPAYAPSGDAVRFRQAIDDDRAVAHAVDARHGNMLGAIVQNVLIDFVGDAVGIPSHTEVTDEFELRSREDFPGGIIRRVQNNCFGVRAKSSREFLFVERPIGSAQLDEARRGAAQDRIWSIVFIERLEDDDLITRINDGHQR